MTTNAAARKALHDDVSTEVAWQVGRRLYVRCAYESKLNTALRDLGAHWDRDQRVLWIGSTKKARVVEALLVQVKAKAQIEAVKQSGRWVLIPYEAHDIRARAKGAGAVYGGDSRKGWWAMPTDGSYAEITAEVDKWNEAAAKARQEAEKVRREEAEAYAAETARAAKAAAQKYAQRVLESSGRTPTGDTTELREISTRRMTKAIALADAREVGELVRLSDGRRGIITGVRVWFTNSEAASSVCWHPETHDEAHWDFAYAVALVEATAEEQAAHDKGVAETRDAADLNTLIDEADKLTAPLTQDVVRIPQEERAGQIAVRCDTPGTPGFDAGTLILTRDGRVVWQHPGYYDDYIATQGTTIDPAVIDRVRRLLAVGDRTRTHYGQLHTHFTVTAGPSD